MDKLKYGIVIVVAGVIALFHWLDPVVIQFKNYSTADLAQQLTPLVLVALFIERSLEVFITAWRGEKEAELQRDSEKAGALPDSDPTKFDRVHKAADALSQYRFATQQIALPAALVLGILIASLGVRGLGNFINVASLAEHHTQKYLFNVADVLLTGALVGGGSDFMHQIITTFTDLMSATSQKAKGAAA